MSSKSPMERLSRVFRNRTRIELKKNHQVLERILEVAYIEHLAKVQAEVATVNPLVRSGRKVFSQNDEDGIIEAIWQRIAPERAGRFVEFGVGDGTENNSLNLLAKGWQGLWFGGEDLRFQATGPRLRFTKCWIDRDNIVSLLQEGLAAMGTPPLDLLSLDLDGNDWHLMAALLNAGVSPPVIILEYNALFTPATHWVMPYDPAHHWEQTAYFGASLLAFCTLLDAHGYRPVGCNLTGVNAFFVRKDFDDRFRDLPSDPERLYMPPRFNRPYPYAGHPVSMKLLETVLA
jgi:hypothetical protein